MQNSTLVWIIIIALVVLGGGWYFYSNQNAGAEQGTLQEEMNESAGESAAEASEGANAGAEAGADVMVGGSTNTEETVAPMSAAVTYNSSGFAPSTVTVKVGGTVTWTSTDGSPMWVASAVHPTHTVYDGTTLQEHCGSTTDTSFDQCGQGSTYSFTFEKAGTWHYHNHVNASRTGTVIVEQ